MNLVLDALELPVLVRGARRLTDEELLEFCIANEPARVEQDANGDLHIMSPNFSEGGAIEGDVYAELRMWALSDGSGKTFGPNAGFTLPDTSVRAADCAWIAWERWNRLTHLQRSGFAQICPEFVIEIRSAKDRLIAIQDKMSGWLGNGASLGWLIDPQRRTIEFIVWVRA